MPVSISVIRADVKRILRAAVARAFTLELAARFLIRIGLLEIPYPGGDRSPRLRPDLIVCIQRILEIVTNKPSKSCFRSRSPSDRFVEPQGAESSAPRLRQRG